jgi:hypothetical protein
MISSPRQISFKKKDGNKISNTFYWMFEHKPKQEEGKILDSRPSTGVGAAMARQSRGAELWSLSQVRQRSRRSRSRSSEGATTKRSGALKSVLQYGRGHSLHFWVSLSASTAEVRAYILVS